MPNQGTIDAMAAKFGGRTMDGLAKKYGDGQVHIVKLKKESNPLSGVRRSGARLKGKFARP